MWKKARKKPIVIEYREPIPNGEIEYGVRPYKKLPVEWVETREGKICANPGDDFVIKGIEGELYPIKKDIFYKTYDMIVEEDTP